MVLGLLTVAAAAYSAGNQINASNAQARAMRDDARNRDNSARAILEAGRNNAARHERAYLPIEGAIRTNYAASGVKLDSVNVLDILRQSHFESEMDRQNIIYGSQIDAYNLRAGANLVRQGASQVQQAGQFSAFGTLLDGVSRGADKMSSPRQPQPGGAGSMLDTPSGGYSQRPLPGGY